MELALERSDGIWGESDRKVEDGLVAVDWAEDKDAVFLGGRDGYGKEVGVAELCLPVVGLGEQRAGSFTSYGTNVKLG